MPAALGVAVSQPPIAMRIAFTSKDNGIYPYNYVHKSIACPRFAKRGPICPYSPLQNAFNSKHNVIAL
jgi:hypothetical protein